MPKQIIVKSYKRKGKRVKAHKRKPRKLPKSAKKKYAKVIRIQIARDKFGRYAGSKRKK